MTTVPAKPHNPPPPPLPFSSSSYKSHNNKQYKITKQKKNVKYKWKLLLQQLCCNFEPNMSPLTLSFPLSSCCSTAPCCPHHFTLCVSYFPPPIRNKANKQNQTKRNETHTKK